MGEDDQNSESSASKEVLLHGVCPSLCQISHLTTVRHGVELTLLHAVCLLVIFGVFSSAVHRMSASFCCRLTQE